MLMPDMSTVTKAKLIELNTCARWSKRMRKYSGTLRMPFA